MKYLSIAVIALSFLVFSACNDDDDVPATYTVGMTHDAFVPASLTVPMGSTVTWNNNNSIPHTVTSSTGLFDEVLDPGEAFSYTFAQTGVYEYICVYHTGMDGVIIVE